MIQERLIFILFRDWRGDYIIVLNNLNYSELTIQQGTDDNVNDTISSSTASTEFLTVLNDTSAVDITLADFTPIANDWWFV